jgi:hypothetical protein
MCDEVTGLVTLNNENQVDNKTVIVAKRGTCTFGDKATSAHEMGAAGILFINNELGNFHVSAPAAHDLSISSATISLDEGAQLIKSLERVQETIDPGYSLKARCVAVMCGNQRIRDVNSYCHPMLPEDKQFVESLDYKGKTSIEGSTFEYLQGDFASWIDPSLDWTTIVPSVIGGDSYCCDPAGFEGNELSHANVILCKRCECDFATKAENVESTGAGLLIVSSHNSTMVRMGCEPISRGKKVNQIDWIYQAYSPYTYLTVQYKTGDGCHCNGLVDAHYSKLDDGLLSKLAILQPRFSDDSCEESEVYNETKV